MTDQSVREQRVAAGSNRRRDLEAVGVERKTNLVGADTIAWANANLPGENYWVISSVRFRLRKQGRPVTAASVREGLRERGWLREQHR